MRRVRPVSFELRVPWPVRWEWWSRRESNVHCDRRAWAVGPFRFVWERNKESR